MPLFFFARRLPPIKSHRLSRANRAFIGWLFPIYRRSEKLISASAPASRMSYHELDFRFKRSRE
jgi:hypothetical protein